MSPDLFSNPVSTANFKLRLAVAVEMSLKCLMKSLSEVESFKNNILSLFEGYVERKSISICTEAEVYQRDYFIEQRANQDRIRKLVTTSPPEKIEDLDLKIIKSLGRNARKSIVEIAEELSTTPRIVDYKIKSLIKRGIITGFRIAINYEKLGINFYKTFFYLDSPKEKRLKELNLFLASNKNVVHNLKVLSNWDLEPEFETSSEEEFNAILKRVKDEFSDIIKKIEVITISKEHKFTYIE